MPRLSAVPACTPAQFSPRRNVLAAAAANGIGFAGFTLVMPFLPLYIRELGVTDVGRHRAVDRAHARRDAGGHGGQRAALGPGRRPLRQQAAGHAIARRVRRHQGGDGVRDRAVAAVRAAGAARRLRRLRRAHGVDGRRVGAARADGRGHRHGAGGAAARAGGRAGGRRRAGAAGRAARARSSWRRCSTAAVADHRRRLPRAADAAGAGRGARAARGVPRAGRHARLLDGVRRHPRPAAGRSQLRPDPAALRRAARCRAGQVPFVAGRAVLGRRGLRRAGPPRRRAAARRWTPRVLIAGGGAGDRGRPRPDRLGAVGVDLRAWRWPSPASPSAWA